MSRLSKNITYNFVGQGAVLVLGFIAVRYVFRQLGEDALGIVYFTQTMSIVLCSVLELGICATTVREVSSHSADEPEYVHSLIRTASLLYWGLYILLAVGVYWGAPLLAENWISLNTLPVATATRMLQILGVSALVALPRSLYMSLLRGLQRMEFNNAIEAGTMSLQQLGTILILILGGDLFQVVYWLALSYVLGLAVYLVVCARFFSLQALVPGFSKGAVRRNFGFSRHMMAISILALVHTQADKIIVSKLLPIGTFGAYGIASVAVSRATLLTRAIFEAAFPSFSSLYRSNDRSALLSQYRKLQDLLCFAAVPLFAAVPFAAEPLFSYLLNAEAARMLLLPSTFLAIGYYMNGALTVPYAVSLAVGKPEIAARQNFWALFGVLPVTFLLIYYFGLAGAGFSWVFYHLFIYAYGVPRICSECLGIGVAEWCGHLLRVLGLVALTYGAAWTILDLVGVRSVLSLSIAYGVASIAYCFGSYLMIGRELRGSFARFADVVKT